MAGAEAPSSDATGIVPAGAPEIARPGLLAALGAERKERDPGEPTNGIEASGLEDASGCFGLARVDGEPAGCTAFRRVDTPGLEIKRMYAKAAHRGHRLAGRLLDAQEAPWRGFGRVILKTGTRQPEAIALYRRRGYRPTEAFGAYVDLPFGVCFGKTLLLSPA